VEENHEKAKKIEGHKKGNDE